ncbi:hypothetical protein ACJX0J_034992, partial [Zea mays]
RFEGILHIFIEIIRICVPIHLLIDGACNYNHVFSLKNSVLLKIPINPIPNKTCPLKIYVFLNFGKVELQNFVDMRQTLYNLKFKHTIGYENIDEDVEFLFGITQHVMGLVQEFEDEFGEPSDGWLDYFLFEAPKTPSK